jgi:anthranilate synthase component I
MKIEKQNIQSYSKKYLADLVTPVSLFLKLRDKFNGGLLLESSDYHSNENALSFLCFDPLFEFSLQKDTFFYWHKNKEQKARIIEKGTSLTKLFKDFMNSFQVEGDELSKPYSGVFGYSSYDIIPHIEKVEFKVKSSEFEIPEMKYGFYRYVIVFNHFNNELLVINNVLKNEQPNFENIELAIKHADNPVFSFDVLGEETSTVSDEDYKELVRKGKQHCQRGDVFQIVLSRRFQQQFKGDEFNVYRALRSINPSPYLFYFDYGNFRIFGSSPEAQLLLKDEKAQIHPIAGTYKRTGDDDADRQAAMNLMNDPKENAEHVMLVDLARNDLSRNTKNVHVETFREVQYFSHVIHLVSKVEGNLNGEEKTIDIFADTFPAGTLSGAPKYKAMQLINEYEKDSRSFYGGAIGYIGLNGDLNHAILIRSFLSIDNCLHYQAGAGIVIHSDEEKELQEVKNKSEALRKAIFMANSI